MEAGKNANYILAACFLLFAGLQYNDPDPWIWIPIYLYASIACLLGAMQKANRPMILFGILFCIGYAGWLLVSEDGVIDWAGEHQAESLVQTMKADKPWIEKTREFGGLLIVAAALGWNMLRRMKS